MEGKALESEKGKRQDMDFIKGREEKLSRDINLYVDV
jgi:hypothetical protein